MEFTGKVARLVKDKGFGFIKSDGMDEDPFFHKSALKNYDYTDLKEGQEVRFTLVHGPKGPRANDITVVEN